MQASCRMSLNMGYEGGVYAQSCGHYLHLDCHKSYIQALSVCCITCCMMVISGHLSNCSVNILIMLVTFSVVWLLS